jgi:hypothetical protein
MVKLPQYFFLIASHTVSLVNFFGNFESAINSAVGEEESINKKYRLLTQKKAFGTRLWPQI